MHRLIIVLLYGIFTSVVSAAEVNNLYQSQAPVSSRAADEREALFPQLLQQVLVKVVGDRNALAQLDLTQVTADSQRYVQQYHYDLINSTGYDLTQPDQLALVVEFNASSVNNLLRQAGLPVWGRLRPDVIVWIAYQSQSQGALLGLENAPEDIAKTLTSTADDRGLPLLVPLMDLQDQTHLTFHDVWLGDFDTVEQASQRYNANVILTARVNSVSGSAQIRWQTKINGVESRWSSEGDMQQAIADGLNVFTDKLAGEYTQVLSDTTANHLSVTVSNVDDYSQYSRLMEYLKRLNTISAVRVVNVSHQQLDLDIAFTGDEAILQRTLALGQMLVDEHRTSDTGKALFRLAP